MKNYAIAVALGLGSLIIPAAASAQVGPVPVINALTAGIPYVTYGFGSAYGAPAASYYATDPWQAAYAEEYGGYGGYYGNNNGYPYGQQVPYYQQPMYQQYPYAQQYPYPGIAQPIPFLNDWYSRSNSYYPQSQSYIPSYGMNYGPSYSTWGDYGY